MSKPILGFTGTKYGSIFGQHESMTNLMGYFKMQDSVQSSFKFHADEERTKQRLNKEKLLFISIFDFLQDLILYLFLVISLYFPQSIYDSQHLLIDPFLDTHLCMFFPQPGFLYSQLKIFPSSKFSSFLLHEGFSHHGQKKSILFCALLTLNLFCYCTYNSHCSVDKPWVKIYQFCDFRKVALPLRVS